MIGRAGGPELVDDGPGTAPSERLERADPNCSRTVTGPLLIVEAGLGAVLERCPVFAARWRGIIVPWSRPGDPAPSPSCDGGHYLCR